jgi:hypothetical protein
MISIKTIYKNLLGLSTDSQKILKEIQDLKLLAGKSLAKESAKAKNLHEAEFKVFSQWGDDGIIQYLIHNIDIQNKVFIEFGVENYTESNTRFLLMNDNWSGLVMDGSEDHVNYIKNDEISWRYDLTAKAAFINAENINDLILKEGIKGNIGLLHVDIDGNDYWVWKNIQAVEPDIVIVEYNSLFGNERPITIPYDPNFVRTKAHYSNLFYGSSLCSLCDLAEERNYSFVGCNSAGNNAYFVKKDKIGSIKPLNAKEGFVNAKFRESRNEKGELTFLNGDKKLKLVKGLKVMNTRTNSLEEL